MDTLGKPLVGADAHLRMKIAGLIPEGQMLARQVLSDALFADMPKTPHVQLEVCTAEIAPGAWTPAHLHHGATVFVILQGMFEAHFDDGSIATCTAGDVYSEPVGKVHRGHNPHDSVPFICISIAATEPGKPHIAILPDMRNDPLARG